MDEALAGEIREFRSPTDGETRMFYEIVVAPGYTPEGLAKLKGKSKTLRILEAAPRAPSGRSLRQIAGMLGPLARLQAVPRCCACRDGGACTRLSPCAPLMRKGSVLYMCVEPALIRVHFP